jgi:uncharacterized protein YbaR (Trm112 family)
MHALSAVELLDVWEYGLSWPQAQRAVELLAVAYPETSRDCLAALSIGQRDARLLALREELWGPRMAALVVCPGCRGQLDLALDTREMLSQSPPEQPHEIPLSTSGYDVTFRLPTSLDVVDAASRAGEDAETCRNLILQNCLLSCQQGDARVDSDELPPEVITELAKAMAEADPLADIQLALTCPSCEQKWRAAFDIVSFLWTEIEVWAWRILTDVHTLAGAYGWRERDILDLSPMRRQFYLEMVGV